MRILFINNGGSGFADYLEVSDGITIQKLLEEKVHGTKLEDLLIRVNRQPVPRDYVLQSGDRVSATPIKIEGAGRRRQR